VRLTKSPRFPKLQPLAGVYPSTKLHEGQRVVVNGWALSDRPVGRKMTFVADAGDAALCSVEDLVLCNAAKLGWYVVIAAALPLFLVKPSFLPLK
jgi:hypothetical protein